MREMPIVYRLMLCSCKSVASSDAGTINDYPHLRKDMLVFLKAVAHGLRVSLVTPFFMPIVVSPIACGFLWLASSPAEQITQPVKRGAAGPGRRTRYDSPDHAAVRSAVDERSGCRWQHPAVERRHGERFRHVGVRHV